MMDITEVNDALCAAYVITHVKSGMLYIGSTNDVVRRWQEHQARLKRGSHGNSKLQALYDSEPNLKIHIHVEEDLQSARSTEQQLLDMHWASGLTVHNGPNIVPTKGMERTEEVRIKIRRTKALNPATDETRAKLRAGRLGKPMPDSAKQALRDFRLGKTMSEDTRSKISKKLEGRKRPERAILMDRVLSGEIQSPYKTKAVSINGVVYPSARHAAHALGLNYHTVCTRVKRPSGLYKDWHYV